jgi:hypothetical protein
VASQPDDGDPIALARANWQRSGWGDVADGMVAVTSVMRAHQILLARVETALRPYDLSFSRYELLRLLAFQPYRRAADHKGVRPAAGARHQRHARDPPPRGRRLVERIPHPTDGRTTLVQITDLGRSTVEDATVTLNNEVFADIGMSDDESRALGGLHRDAAPQLGDF